MRRGNKYGAQRAQSAHFGARWFDSTAERDRAEELRSLEAAGEIKALTLQPKVDLTAGITWKLDFSYTEQGRTVWEDVKGVIGRDVALKVRLWREYGPGLLRLTRRANRQREFTVVREVMAQGGGA